MAILDRIFKQDFRLSRGTARLISRNDNVLSALENRFATTPRSIPFRPVYGSSLKRYSNEPITKELENKIIEEIKTQLRRERRVRLIRQISIDSTNDGNMRINVQCILLGQKDTSQFEVVI